MTYTFPKSLAPLREYLRGQGADVRSFVTARQAAFMAQQIIGSRVKFPPQGQDMTSTLFLIQQALPDGCRLEGQEKNEKPVNKAVQGGRPGKARHSREGRKAENYAKHFTPALFASGVHIFCDGAAVPNPGFGGWGVAVYQDGAEIASTSGGDAETTNNKMELMAILAAIEEAWKHVAEWDQVTIWSDSQYCVQGINEWLPTWKARGWNKRKLVSPKREDGEIKNLDLWQAIDASLSRVPEFGKITIKWVKGHIGIAGNERADELAEIGRAEVEAQERGSTLHHCEDLDEAYRKIMGAM